MLTAIDAAYRRLLAGLGLLAGASFAALALLVTLNVVLRATRLAAMPWLLEFSEYLLFWATLLAAPWVLSLGAHVRVDLLLSGLGPGAARRVEIAVDVMGLAISAALFYYSLLATMDAYRIGSLIIKELVIAEWWLFAVMPATTLLLVVEFMRRAAYAWRHEPADGPAPPRDGL